MANIEDAYSALKNAHEAGDKEAATKIADYIHSQKSIEKPEKKEEKGFFKEFGETFHPVKAITEEGIVPQAYQYAKRQFTKEPAPKAEEKPEKPLSFTDTFKQIKSFATSNPGAFAGTLANAIVADPEFLFMPEFIPAKVISAAEKFSKLGAGALKTADVAAQSGAAAAAQSIVKQLNETNSVDMNRVRQEAKNAAMFAGIPYGAAKAVKGAAKGGAEAVIGQTQPHITDLAKKAESMGFELEPAQLRADKPIGSPGFTKESKAKNEELATRFASKETGKETNNITPAFINERKKALGKEYDHIFGRNISIDSQSVSEFAKMRNFEISVSPAGNRKITSSANNLINRWKEEYANQLQKTIINNVKRTIKKQGRGGVEPIVRLKKDWPSIRNSDAPNAPVWAKDVEAVVHDLAEKLGLKITPQVWFSSPRREGTYGMATGDGHIVIHDKLDEKGAVATALHELGHQAEFQMFVHAPLNERNAVVQAWINQMRETPEGVMTVEQHRPITAEKYGKEARLSVPDLNYEKGYLRNFNEWYAEQTSRWITQTAQPTTVVDKFFKKIADVWKQIYQRVTGYLPLRHEVDAFYRSKWKGDTLNELTIPTAMEGEDPSVLLAPHHVTAPIDGRELQRLRSSISDIARSHPDGLIRESAGEFVSKIDAMIERDNPEIAEKLKDTNRKYAATMTIENGVRKNFVHHGKISLEGLGRHLAGANDVHGFGSGTSRHPLYDLGYMGRELQMRSRFEGEEIPEYDLAGALLGRAKQLMGSAIGARSQYAREAQKRYFSLPEKPQEPQRKIPVAPYAGIVSNQAEQEKKRKLQQALKTQIR